MAGRKVKLEWARPLPPTLSAPAGQPLTHGLPASFPAHLLDDDQLEAVETWFDTWQADTLDRVKACLNLPAAEGAREGAPLTLRELAANAVVLAHLLRLHPAAEHTLSILAGELGVRHRKLQYIAAGIMRTLGGIIPAAPVLARWPGLRKLADMFPQLNFAARSGHRPVYIVPFRQHYTLAEQWDTVCTLAKLPGIATVTLDVTPAAADAVRITLNTPSKKHAKR